MTKNYQFMTFSQLPFIHRNNISMQSEMLCTISYLYMVETWNSQEKMEMKNCASDGISNVQPKYKSNRLLSLSLSLAKKKKKKSSDGIVVGDSTNMVIMIWWSVYIQNHFARILAAAVAVAFANIPMRRDKSLCITTKCMQITLRLVECEMVIFSQKAQYKLIE